MTSRASVIAGFVAYQPGLPEFEALTGSISLACTLHVQLARQIAGVSFRYGFCAFSCLDPADQEVDRDGTRSCRPELEWSRMKNGLSPLKRLGRAASLLLGCTSLAFAQKLPAPTRVWSLGPLTKSEMAMGATFGAEGVSLTGPRVDPQTASMFSATRSVVFAGDRIVLASKVGVRNVEGARIPETVYQLLSLDALTGAVKDTRDISAFGSLELFSTDDAHVIVSGHNVMRLTPDLKDAGSFDYRTQGWACAEHLAGRIDVRERDESGVRVD